MYYVYAQFLDNFKNLKTLFWFSIENCEEISTRNKEDWRLLSVFKAYSSAYFFIKVYPARKLMLGLSREV